MKTFLKILTLFIAIGAVGGAVMMWVDPSGGGHPAVQESPAIIGMKRCPKA